MMIFINFFFLTLFIFSPSWIEVHRFKLGENNSHSHALRCHCPNWHATHPPCNVPTQCPHPNTHWHAPSTDWHPIPYTPVNPQTLYIHSNFVNIPTQLYNVSCLLFISEDEPKSVSTQKSWKLWRTDVHNKWQKPPVCKQRDIKSF